MVKTVGIRAVVSLIVTIVLAKFFNYFMLVTMSGRYVSFWFAWIGIVLIFIASYLIMIAVFKRDERDEMKYSLIGSSAAILAITVILIGGAFTSWALFRSVSYYEMIQDKIVVYDEGSSSELQSSITIDDGNPKESMDTSELPIYDDAAVKKIANAFSLTSLGLDSSSYTLGSFNDISINICGIDAIMNYSEYLTNEDIATCTATGTLNKLYGIAPINYNGFWKYNSNKDNGISHLILVDKTDGTLIPYKLKETMFYTPSAAFSKDLDRNVYKRCGYTNDPVEYYTIELDDDGNAWWIGSELKQTIGLFGGEDIQSIIKVNPNSGTCERITTGELEKDDTQYKWVDTVYPFSMLERQINLYGKYENGFWNGNISQKGVLETTPDSLRVLYSNGDIYHYTTYTSVSADEAAQAVLFINSRTKEVQMLKIQGVVESKAQIEALQAISEGNAYSYTVDKPILYYSTKERDFIYFVSFSGNDTPRDYALVRYTDGVVVEYGSIEDNNPSSNFNDEDLETVEPAGVLENVRYNDANSYVILKFVGDDNVYYMLYSDFEYGELNLLNSGSTFITKFKYDSSETTQGMYRITSINWE